MSVTHIDHAVRTLVVDDDFAVAALHRAFLEQSSRFEVVGEAHLGVDALHAVEELKPELILLDIYLPDISGLEVLQRLRARPGPPVDVIAITAARELDMVRAAMAGGVLNYLVKPFTMDIFTDRLEAYLAQRAELRRATGHTSGPLDQQQVDELLRAHRHNRPTRLPKGLSERTLDLVMSALSDAGADLSATEIGQQIGLSRIAARRYLQYLVDSGRAAVTPKYGASGRPEHRYVWLAG